MLSKRFVNSIEIAASAYAGFLKNATDPHNFLIALAT